MVSRIFVIIGIILAPYYVEAQQLMLSATGHLEVKGRMKHLRDAEGSVILGGIAQARFEPIDTADSPNYGFDRAVHWFKMELTNTSQQEDWLLEVAYAPLDQLDFYIQDNASGTWLHKTAGDLQPIAVRDLQHRHPLFAFQLAPGKSQTIYLRVKTISSVQLPVTIWSREAFLQASFHIQIINGIFYGAMLVMILYQLFLFSFMRDQTTLFYVFTLLSMVNIVAFFQGYTFLYFFPDAPWLNDIFASFSGPAFILFSTLLSRSFLNLRSVSRWLDNLLIGNMLVDVFMGVLMCVFFRRVSYEYHHYFMLMHCVLTLSSAAYCLVRRYIPALYYLLSWLTILLATAFFTMSNLGFVPGYMSTNYTGLMIGCVLQMLFIAFALGERWNRLMRENQEAKELENERLEREVRLRTEEINHKNERLEEVIRVKDKLFSVVSHDIKGPLSSLQMALTLTKTGTVSPEEFQALTGALDQRFSQTTEFIENLLQWAQIQLKGGTFDPGKLNLHQLSSAVLRLLDPELCRKDIVIENAIQESLYVYADQNMIHSVFRNLLTNAIKFTGKAGHITLRSRKEGKFIVLSISDTGVGIPEKNRNRLFTLSSITTQGTRHEKGTGLGLLLCKEFVEKNGGQIWLESEVAKGTTFFFSLPEYAEEAVTSAEALVGEV